MAEKFITLVGQRLSVIVQRKRREKVAARARARFRGRERKLERARFFVDFSYGELYFVDYFPYLRTGSDPRIIRLSLRGWFYARLRPFDDSLYILYVCTRAAINESAWVSGHDPCKRNDRNFQGSLLEIGIYMHY